MICALEQDLEDPSVGSLSFSLGEIDFCVQSELDEVLSDLEELYGGFRRAGAADRPIRMSVTLKRFLAGKRYIIQGDGKVIGQARRRGEVLPYLEWGINARVIATRDDFLLLHAATMVRNGQGVMFPGGSGSGKSTLAAALLARGWKYLCDELALIHPDTLYLHPFPKALCIKRGAFDLVQRLNLTLWRRYHYVKVLKGRVAYINPRAAGPRSIAPPAPIRYVVFPKYRQGTEPRTYPITRARAACAMAAHALNRHVFGGEVITMLGEITRTAACVGLESGDIDATCDLLDAIVR